MRNVNCHSNNLRQRFVSHSYLIGHKKLDHEVPRHFNAKDHRGIHDVEIHVLEFIKDSRFKIQDGLLTNVQVNIHVTVGFVNQTINSD